MTSRSIFFLVANLVLWAGCSSPDTSVMPDAYVPENDAGAVDAFRDDTGPDHDAGPPDDGGSGPVCMNDNPPMCPAFSCPAPVMPGPAPSCPPVGARDTIMVPPGNIDPSMLTWTCDHIYRLSGLTFVNSGTLTIAAGTRVEGQSSGEVAALVVTANGRIEAAGHPEAPIVFTSGASCPTRGDWGGVVLLGRAPINVAGGENRIEGVDVTDPRGLYGGNDAAHDCGSLNYVRIEYAGFELAPLNELNGLTIGGCGTGTEIDYVQVHLGNDDGIEMFGGTAGLRHIVISQAQDDSLDWDLGWRGDVQFAILQQGTVARDADFGIEADSNDLDNAAQPRAAPTIYNATLIGSNNTVLGDERGILLRRGTWGTFRNLIVMGFPGIGARVEDSESESGLANCGLTLRHSLFFQNGPDGMTHIFRPPGEQSPEYDAFTAMESRNTFDVDPQLTAPYDRLAPNFAPTMAPPVNCGAVAPPPPFDTGAAYMGAIGPGCPDWTAGWTAYPELCI